jgi:hypothetical protein
VLVDFAAAATARDDLSQRKRGHWDKQVDWSTTAVSRRYLPVAEWQDVYAIFRIAKLLCLAFMPAAATGGDLNGRPEKVPCMPFPPLRPLTPLHSLPSTFFLTILFLFPDAKAGKDINGSLPANETPYSSALIDILQAFEWRNQTTNPGPWRSQNVKGQLRENWLDIPSFTDVIRDYLPTIQKHSELYRKPGKPPGDPAGDAEAIPDEWWSKLHSTANDPLPISYSLSLLIEK